MRLARKWSRWWIQHEDMLNYGRKRFLVDQARDRHHVSSHAFFRRKKWLHYFEDPFWQTVRFHRSLQIWIIHCNAILFEYIPVTTTKSLAFGQRDWRSVIQSVHAPGSEEKRPSYALWYIPLLLRYIQDQIRSYISQRKRRIRIALATNVCFHANTW